MNRPSVVSAECRIHDTESQHVRQARALSKTHLHGPAPYSSDESSDEDDYQTQTYSPILDIEGDAIPKSSIHGRSASNNGCQGSVTRGHIASQNDRLCPMRRGAHRPIPPPLKSLHREKSSTYQIDGHDSLSIPNSPAFPSETASPMTPSFLHQTMVLPAELTDAEALDYHQQVQHQQENQLLRTLSTRSNMSFMSIFSDTDYPVETAMAVNYLNPQQRPNIVSVSPTSSTASTASIVEARKGSLGSQTQALKVVVSESKRISMLAGFPAAEATEFTTPTTPADDLAPELEPKRGARFSTFAGLPRKSVNQDDELTERQARRLNHAKSMQHLPGHSDFRSQSSANHSNHSSISTISGDRPKLSRTQTDLTITSSGPSRNPNLTITVDSHRPSRQPQTTPHSTSVASKQRVSMWLDPFATSNLSTSDKREAKLRKNSLEARSPGSGASSATTSRSFLSSPADLVPSPAYSSASSLYSPCVAPIEESKPRQHPNMTNHSRKKSFSRFRSPSIPGLPPNDQSPMPNIPLPSRKDSLPIPPSISDPNHDAASVHTTASSTKGSGGSVLSSFRRRRGTTLGSSATSAQAQALAQARMYQQPQPSSQSQGRPNHIPIVPKIDTSFINGSSGSGSGLSPAADPAGPSPGALKRMGTKIGWGKRG